MAGPPASTLEAEAPVAAMAATERLGRCRPCRLPPRALGKDDVEVRVSFCGVSRADLHALGRPGGAFPLVLGQEVVGVVTRVGARVRRLAVGDRVGVGAQRGACLNRGPAYCPECAVGQEAYCCRAAFAYDAPWLGGFADRVRVASRFAFKVPENIPTRVAAPLFGAGLAAYTALAGEKVARGARVGVVGVGGLGHLALQFSLALGASPVAFSSTSSKRADAAQLGADEFYCTLRPADLARAAGSIDLLLVATDAPPPRAELLALLTPTGSLVTVAEPGEPGSRAPPTAVVTAQGQRVARSRLGSIADMERMLALVREVNLRPVATSIPMSQLDEGLGRLRQRKVRYRLVAANDLGEPRKDHPRSTGPSEAFE